MIDRIDKPKEAEDYITGKMLEVKHILDDIASETGVCYMVMENDTVAFMSNFGMAFGKTLLDCHKIAGDRLGLAVQYENWLIAQHKEEAK